MFLQLHLSTGHTLQGDIWRHDAPHGDPPSARVWRRSDPCGGQERPGWSGVQHLTAGHAQGGLACPPQAGPQRSVPLVVTGLWLLSCLILSACWKPCLCWHKFTVNIGCHSCVNMYGVVFIFIQQKYHVLSFLWLSCMFVCEKYYCLWSGSCGIMVFKGHFTGHCYVIIPPLPSCILESLSVHPCVWYLSWKYCLNYWSFCNQTCLLVVSKCLRTASLSQCIHLYNNWGSGGLKQCADSGESSNKTTVWTQVKWRLIEEQCQIMVYVQV